jgi:hypothetical protein
MPVIGQVQIDANIVENNASPDFIGSILKAANWDIKNISIRNTYGFHTLSIIADMWSSLDAGQIERWIREDLGNRLTIGAVSVKVLSRTGKKATPSVYTGGTGAPEVIPTKTVTTGGSNADIAAVNSRLDLLIANLNKSNSGTPTTKKTLDSYAAEFGVSKTALTLLVAAVGITVLLSLTAKK